MSRNTAAKTHILSLIRQSETALSQPAIQQSMNGLCDRVTIYRVLDRLTEEGLIHRIVNVNGTVNYAACHHCGHTHKHRHIHFSCSSCEQITCLETVEPSYRLPDGYVESETYFTISGLCSQCTASSV